MRGFGVWCASLEQAALQKKSRTGVSSMAKLRHIAIAAEDPYATAEFYKQAFDFVEVRRTEPRGEGSSYGVFLSDGTISLAILRFGWDQGPGIDFRGIHHFGVLVEDVDTSTDKLEKLGAKCFARRPPDVKTFYETKFHGPDRVVFDITDHPWKGAAPLPNEAEAKDEARALENVSR
jgi:catechol 2,3-dioxygenase-like lactoylglutathione lyase family enzyme